MDLKQASKPTITDPYMIFYNTAKELYKDEQAIQSATATMYIRYNNLVDKSPNFNALLKKLTEQADADVSTQAPTPFNEIIRTVYAPLMKESNRAKMYIDEKLKEPIYDFYKFKEDLEDYMLRNRIEFNFICNLRPTED